MPPLLITPLPRDTLLRNSPLNPSLTNMELKMITPVPALTNLNHKIPTESSKENTVSPFPMAVLKLSPTQLTMPVDSSLMSNTKVLPNIPQSPREDTDMLLLPNMLLLLPNMFPLPLPSTSQLRHK